MNGDGDRNTDVFETGVNNRQRNVSYGAVENATTVLLPRDAAHKRQDYNVSVELTGGLELTRTIHVALDVYIDTALTGATQQQRHDEVNTIATVTGPWGDIPTNTALPGNPPTVLSQEWWEQQYGLLPAPPADTMQSGNRLQYAIGSIIGSSNGLTVTNILPLSDKRVYIVMVGPGPYSDNQTRDDVRASINHEQLHVNQGNAIRLNQPAKNVWWLLDRYYLVDRTLSANEYTEFGEAEAHLSELNDSNLGWFHLHGNNLQTDLDVFVGYYNNAVTVEQGMTSGTTNDAEAKAAATNFLRQMYTNNLPSELAANMKTYGWVNGYDNFVRPPLS